MYTKLLTDYLKEVFYINMVFNNAAWTKVSNGITLILKKS